MYSTAPRNRRTPVVLAGGLCALLLIVLVGYLLAGGRFQAVETPSMAEAAPVGTLVLTLPGDAEVGDIITFTPTGATHSYTHRVIEVTGGGYHTQGDLNGAVDPWTVTPNQVEGVAWLRLWTLGWVARALPIVAIGALLTFLITRFLFAADYRYVGRVMGGTLTVAVASLLLRPWTGVQLVGYLPANEGITASVVSTGILPMRVTARGGTSADLVNGQLGSISTAVTGTAGKYNFDPALHLSTWWLIGLIALCSLPFLLCLREFQHDNPRATRARPYRLAVPAATIGVLAVIAALLVVPTRSAFAARITNSTDTAGSRTWFTCRAAETGTAGLVAGYAMGTGGLTGEANLAGGNAGEYFVGSTVQTGNVGCVRDTPAASVTFNGTSQCLATGAATAAAVAPNTFSTEIWFRTSTAGNGKLIGYSSSRTGTADSTYDRHLYIDPQGRLVFGVYNPGVVVVSSSTSVANNQWHQAIATLGPAGMRLYVDGVQVGANANQFAGQSYSGWWKIGCGILNGWTSATGTAYNGPTYYTGQLQYAAIYTVQLSAAQVLEHYQARVG